MTIIVAYLSSAEQVPLNAAFLQGLRVAVEKVNMQDEREVGLHRAVKEKRRSNQHTACSPEVQTQASSHSELNKNDNAIATVHGSLASPVSLAS